MTAAGHFDSCDDYIPWLRERAGCGSDLTDLGLDCNTSTMARPWHLAEELHPTNWVVSESIGFLRRRDPKKPFFLWMSFVRPHPPFDPPQSYWARYADADIPEPPAGDWAQADDPLQEGLNPVTGSGRVPKRLTGHGRNADQQLDEQAIAHVPTMADLFQEAGYRTASFGKLHLTCTRAPRSCGHEESRIRWAEEDMDAWRGPYYGFRHVELTIGHGEDYVGHYACWLEREPPDVAERVRGWNHRGSRASRGLLYESVVPEEAHSSTWIADRALAYVDGWEAERGSGCASGEEPLFLFLGFPDPHFPFTPPASLAEQFRDQEPPQGVRCANADQESARRPRAWSAYYGEGAIQNVRRYEEGFETHAKQYTNAMIHLIDKSVGRVVERFEQVVLADNTIIVYTSDHGDFLGDHGLVFKANLGCRALNHVPFIMKAPPWLSEQWPARSSAVMSNIDVLPTLCELAGIEIPREAQGRSASPRLEGSGAESEPALVICVDDSAEGNKYSLWNDRFRYTWYPVSD